MCMHVTQGMIVGLNIGLDPWSQLTDLLGLLDHVETIKMVST